MKRWISILVSIAILTAFLPTLAFAEGNNKFNDVTDGEYYAEAANSLAELKILDGYEDGSFGADKSVTRAEMAAIICRVLDKEKDAEKAEGKTDFDDVSSNHWASGYINIATDEKIIQGDGDGKFRPEDNVKYEEAIKMVVCALGLGDDVKIDSTDWSTGYIAKAKENKITNDLKGSKGKASTRGDIAVMVYNGLTKDLAAPTASKQEGSYSGTQKISLSTTTKDAVIYYTTDGTAPTVKSTKYTKEISISKTTTLRAIAVLQDVLASDEFKAEYTISSSSGSSGGGGGSSSSSKKYTVSFDLNYDGATDAPASQSVKKGETATIPQQPTRENFVFAGWYTDKSYSSAFDFDNTIITQNYTLVARWINVGDKTDSDEDGLINSLEDYYGTDKNNIDTDNDGLSDYVEIMQLALNPLKIDSDDNGINDGDEDNDLDGIKNIDELNIGTNPILSDTDSDGLTDKDELEKYSTDPLKDDTDGDGALDGIEIYYNTNPLIADSTFNQTATSEEISENNTVAAMVTANINGESLGTVSVDSVSSIDNAFITENIAGYLGNAYEFKANGNINSADITFTYDTALGTVGDEFQPRIYYFNEETQELEELPNQIVADGMVQVSVSHFSTYILLNKIEFDEVWNNEIKPPIATDDGSEATLNIAFVIDYSASMDGNDSQKLFKKLSKEFVAKLRDGKDSATVIKFIRRATLVSELTSDKEKLNKAIDSISYDSGYSSYSGTDGSTGYKMALDELSKTDSKYKYIIFITDGEDNGYTYDYDDLIQTSISSDVVTYTIGMGSASESVLKKIAEQTKGKYYHATTGTATGDIIDLDNVFEDIQGETIDKTTDTNNDGIPDYYNELIKNGTLVLSNGSDEFIGYDFNYDENGNISDDFDGDGLKNGEEISVTQKGNKVYLKMNSNPTLKDTDFDSRDDKVEKTLGTNPLKYSYNNSDVYALLNNDMYCGYLLADKYDSDFLFALSTNLNDTLSFNWTPTKACKELYLDYFYDYANDSIESISEKNKKMILLENTKDTLTSVNKVIGYINKGKKYIFDNPTKELEKLYILRSQLNSILNQLDIASKNVNQSNRINKLTEDWLAVTQKINDYGIVSKFSVKVTDFADKYQHLMNKKNFTGLKNSTTISVATTVFSTGVNIADTVETYAKLNANTTAFSENLDILAYLSTNGNRDVSRNAANQMFDLVANDLDSYGSQLSTAIGEDVIMGGTKYAVSYLVNSNPYTKAIKAAYDAFDLLIGTSHKAQCIDTALYLESFTTAMCELINDELTETQFSYDCIRDNNEISDRYLTHLAQMRIVGEDNFVNYTKNTGLISQFFKNGYSEAKDWCDSQIQSVWQHSSNLKLTLSKNLSGYTSGN